VHVLATLGALLVLNVIGLAVAGGLYIDFVREHGPLPSEIPEQSEVAEPERTELAERFAPVLRLDSAELFVPIRREAYVSRTQLKEEEGRFIKLLDAAPDLLKLPTEEGICLLSRGCHYFLDVRGVEPDPPKRSAPAYAAIQDELLRRGERPTAYAHVSKYEDSGEYAVQYWFLYFFNYRLNEHESDWEQITVRLDSDKNPVDVFYSAHEGGNIAQWRLVEKRGDHPVVYAGRGSHANYFRPGRHRVAVGCKRIIGSIKSCFRGRKLLVDVTDGLGRSLGPGRYEMAELTGPLFIGSFGSGNYVVLTRRPDILADPRTRRIWRDPLGPLR
jgi:hypothetical protein